MIVSVNNSIILCFNPRTHGGYDKNYPFPLIFCYCFNPRTHGGYDAYINDLIKRDLVLIPVPTEGTMAKLYKINNNSTVLFR